jgi:hypothetical protein
LMRECRMGFRSGLKKGDWLWARNLSAPSDAYSRIGDDDTAVIR